MNMNPSPASSVNRRGPAAAEARRQLVDVMHTVDFRILNAADTGPYGEIEIRVDGVDFRELVRDHEMPFAKREGSPRIAGGYCGLPASPEILPPSRHFLGEPIELQGSSHGKVHILECQCGFPGCWPLLCRISVAQDTAIWSDFEQPHRGAAAQGRSEWRYDAFGPFRFRRSQYEASLSAAAEASAS